MFPFRTHTHTIYSRPLLLAGLLCGLIACKEPAIDEGILPLSEPATVDANGGTWRTLVLASATDIAVPQPTAITSDAYKQELTAVKNGVLAATPEQNTAVNYWAAGGVRRWNQIARQLVAKYNIIPDYTTSPTGTANPLAGTPFVARVFALLSVAQYDALVVAWRAKYQYNRPSLDDQGLVPRVPIANVPSYPSEDAAIAEASCQVLAYLFPNETAWLKAKATEHKQSRLWAGANVPSDIKAGEDLATAVAAKIMDRASRDRFNAAPDPTNTWTSLAAKAPYDQTWQSLEIPARSPVLPLAGKVKTWFDSTTIFRASPAAPPATTSSAFQTALNEVRTTATNRTRDQWSIADYWADGGGTYALPGHWNALAEDLIWEQRQNELRSARTYALLNRAMHDGSTASWNTMYTYFVPRPSQVDASIKTASLIPNNPGYVCDHATVSTAAALVLAYLFPDEATNLTAKGTEASLSRLYSGTNYRFDIDEGVKWGTVIGNLAVTAAKSDGAK